MRQIHLSMISCGILSYPSRLVISWLWYIFCSFGFKSRLFGSQWWGSISRNYFSSFNIAASSINKFSARVHLRNHFLQQWIAIILWIYLCVWFNKKNKFYQLSVSPHKPSFASEWPQFCRLIFPPAPELSSFFSEHELHC